MQWEILEGTTANKKEFFVELNKYKRNGWYIHLETFGINGDMLYLILSKGFDI
jgi:hypothetical protein